MVLVVTTISCLTVLAEVRVDELYFSAFVGVIIGIYLLMEVRVKWSVRFITGALPPILLLVSPFKDYVAISPENLAFVVEPHFIVISVGLAIGLFIVLILYSIWVSFVKRRSAG